MECQEWKNQGLWSESTIFEFTKFIIKTYFYRTTQKTIIYINIHTHTKPMKGVGGKTLIAKNEQKK